MARSRAAYSSMPGYGYLKQGGFIPQPKPPAPAPRKACGAIHPHRSWNPNAGPCSTNVLGLPGEKHEGAHRYSSVGGIDDIWNDAGVVWDSDPIESCPANERGAFCPDAWGPVGTPCGNPRCKTCRAEVAHVG